MAPFPYVLDFPLTGLTFSCSFSAILRWITRAAVLGVVPWLMVRVLQKDSHSPWKEKSILGPLKEYRSLFTSHGDHLGIL